MAYVVVFSRNTDTMLVCVCADAGPGPGSGPQHGDEAGPGSGWAEGQSGGDAGAGGGGAAPGAVQPGGDLWGARPQLSAVLHGAAQPQHPAQWVTQCSGGSEGGAVAGWNE